MRLTRRIGLLGGGRLPFSTFGVILLLAVCALLLAACGGKGEETAPTIRTPRIQAAAETPRATPVPPTDTPAPVSEGGPKLLFVYSPGCPHCAYQRPVIREFEERNPEVAVTWVGYADLNREQRKLIEGTSGHPVMVFHDGAHVRQVVGETPLADLEEEYGLFEDQLAEKGGSKTTTGSRVVCR